MKYFKLNLGSFLTERTLTLLEFVSKIEGQQNGAGFQVDESSFEPHVRESEKNFIEDLIFERSTRSPLNVNTRVRFYNILPWFPLFLVALFCLFREVCVNTVNGSLISIFSKIKIFFFLISSFSFS